jgi:ribosomal protein S18 acetylase RimI-like enzyme
VSEGGKLQAGAIALRRADSGDLPRLVALQQAAYARNRTLLGVEPIPLQADYQQIFADYEVWLAEAERRLVGVLILEPRAGDLMIWSIATDPARQSKGLGRALLGAAEVRARELGHDCIRLYTGTKLEHLVAWYGRHGYALERIEELSDRSVTHMMKRLAKG